MILIHELGHYWAARFFDVRVDTFSFGFGPRLFGFRKGETDFRFSLVPFGGYVKMAGDQPADNAFSGGENEPAEPAAAPDPRALFSKPRWQRTIIAFAGPAINMVLAVTVMTGLYMVQFPKIPMPHSPVVGFVMPDGPAAKAGIREGDQVLQVDDLTDPTWQDIQLKEVASARRPMEVWVRRDGQRLHFTITPNYDEKQAIGYAGWFQETQVQVVGYYSGIDTAQKAGLMPGDIIISVNGVPILNTSRMREVIDQAKGAPVRIVFSRNGERREAEVMPVRKDVDGQERWMIGVSLEPKVDVVKLPLWEAAVESAKTNVQSAKLIFKVLEGIVERRMSPKSLEGPIRIAQLSGQAAKQGPATFFELMAAVSLNLAIVNLLPIPILDGGVILMLLVEMLLRRDVDLKVKEAVVKVGFVFLMAVLVFAIYNDISKILPPG